MEIEIEQINTFKMKYPDKALRMDRVHLFQTTATKEEVKQIIEHLNPTYDSLESNLKRGGFYCKEIETDLEKRK